MKPAILLTQSEKTELDAFCRVASPLTVFVRSLQMNLAQAKGAEADPKESEGDDVPSLLKGLDLDSLPDDVRKALESKESEFKTIYNEKQKSDAAKTEADKKAVHFQSLADKRHETLRKHNLHEDGKQQQSKQTPEETMVEEIRKDFEAQGMKPEAALAYAKMHASVMSKQSERIVNDVTNRVMPLAQTVSTMQANSMLEAAGSSDNDPNGILQIPEIRTEVEKQVGFFANQGTMIDVPFVQKLINMEYGAYVQKNPDAVLEKQTAQVQTLPTRLNTGGGGGGNGYRNATPRGQQTQGAPVARDAETAKAFQQTADILLKGIKRK